MEVLISPKKYYQDDEKLILDYLERFPKFSFKSSRLSNLLNLNPTKTSRTLRAMYMNGVLERRCRRNGKGLVCFYRYKQNRF